MTVIKRTSTLAKIVDVVLVVIAGLFLVTEMFGIGPHPSATTNAIYQNSAMDTLPPMWEARNQLEYDNPYDLSDPSVVREEIEYNSGENNYTLSKKIGDEFFEAPVTMSFADYLAYKQNSMDKEFMKKMNGLKDNSSFLGFAAGQADGIDPINEMKLGQNLAENIFGGAQIDIKPQGFIDFTFGANYSRNENPQLPPRSQRIFQPIFDMNINMRVEGGIGDKFRLGWDYNTEATFDFDNRIKLAYDSENWSEDEIIKKVEAGDVSLPLNSQLIQGSQRLFGIKTEMQFGKLRLTALASQQKTRKKEIVIENGGQVQEFFKYINEYDENKHFFLTHYNRETYDRTLRNLPQINTLFQVQQIEVWTTNQNQTETDDLSEIIAIADLGEAEVFNSPGLAKFGPPQSTRHPDIYNGKGLPGFEVQSGVGANDLFNAVRSDDALRNKTTARTRLESEYGLSGERGDYEIVRARRLQQGQDYFLEPQLGFISLNRAVETDEVLAVAIKYKFNGKEYQIGEFFDDADSVLMVKMLKSTQNDVSATTWDLMMKNVYSIGAYQVQQEDFQLDVFYDDPGKGEKRFLPETNLEGQPLIQVLNLDNLNPTGDPQPDGRFDFVPGLTILPRTGKIIFPVLEPFGKSLADSITDPNLKEKYSFPKIYETTIFESLQFADQNRFVIRGKFKSEVTTDISLGAFNIPEGSVRVTAGGRQLQEGIDYEIDYNIGRVKILNESYLASGPVKITYEDNALFGFQTKTMLGMRADYTVSPNFNIGGTFMHLYERPFTQKVNIGDDPINNRVFGLDVSYEKEAPWITRLVDKIPGIDTKEESRIKLYAETAFLKPGHSRAIRQGDDDEGTVYLDDFEGSNNGVPIETFYGNWMLASTPREFRESELSNDTRINVNRALTSWYQIQERNGSSNGNLTRQFTINDIFPNRQINQAQRISNFFTFDVAYFPNERGPYNFDLTGGTDYSAGLNQDGNLKEASTRWGGLMTNNNQSDFERANYQTVEFWMMSPYVEDEIDDDGYLVLNLGSINEDVMKDNRAFAEHGLPVEGDDNVVRTNLSRLSTITPAIFGFENTQEARDRQDLGFDGADDQQESSLYESYINDLDASSLTPLAYNNILQDPAGDNHIRPNQSTEPTILGSYKRFAMPQGDSPISTGGQGLNQQFKNTPDQEDLDQDGSLDQLDKYYEYRIPIEHDGNGGLVENEFITDTRVIGAEGSFKEVKWYRFRIPLNKPTANIGGITNLRNMQFFRMYFTEFDTTKVFRFVQMEYGRNLWRKFDRVEEISTGGLSLTPLPTAELSVSAVNIEEHGDRNPFNYVIPNGIVRERIQSFQQQLQQNEQSLSLDVSNFHPTQGVGIFKELFLDLRRYKRLKLMSHLENKDPMVEIKDKEDISLFIRLGSDYTNNYYEYEVPLTYSDTSAIKGLQPASREYKDEVWNPENEIDLDLRTLIDLKRTRNNNELSLEEVFSIIDPNDPDSLRTFRIKGNPNLGYVKGIMIGLRNISDDPNPKHVDVWVNELRVTGLDERGGMAALAQVEAQLADFGNLALSGRHSTIGYGDLDQKVNQRSLEDNTVMDASINLELGKFFKEESGIRIPFYAQFNQEITTPEFDPYDLDVKLDDKISDADDRTARDSISEQAKEITTIKSFNFTNVRKERTGGKKSMPWDVENLTASYAYTETDQTDPIIELNNEKTHNGSLGYSWSMRPAYVYPLKKLIKKGKYLKLLKDFNFNPIPNSYNFNTVVDRKFGEARYRFTIPEYSTWYTKRFTWDRNYGLKWDITQSLKFNYNSRAMAVIDEPDGKIDTQEKRDSIWTNVRDFGRVKNYNHAISVSYDLPIDKIPILEWVNTKVQYNGGYDWSVAALNMDSLGNIIQNNQKIQVTGDFNFQKLYRKSKYFSKIDRGSSSRGRRSSTIGRNNRQVTQGVQKGNNARSSRGDRETATWEKILVRPLMMMRRARLNYSETRSTIIPGFTPRAKFLGMNDAWEAPGWEFISGIQPNLGKFLPEAADNGWITSNLFLNRDVVQDYAQNIDGRITLEPFNDLSIDLNINRKVTENHTETFKVQEKGGDWLRSAQRDVGSYSISYFALNTLIGGDIDQLFNTFENNRTIISNRLGTGDHLTDIGYTEGYGRLQQDVVLPAFIAAYTGRNASNVKLDVLDLRPKMNWDLTYNGLSRIAFFRDRIKQFTLKHGYQSTLQVNTYNTEQFYQPNEKIINDQTDNFYSRFEIPDIVIQEDLSPLLGINMTLQNDLQMGVDFAKSRNLRLNFISDNKQVIESNSTTFSFSFGYLFKEVSIGFLGGKKEKVKRKKPSDRNDALGLDELGDTELGQMFDFSVVDEKTGDLNMAVDVSIRDEITKNHLIDKDTDQVTRGSRIISVQPSVDYSLNKKVNFRLFFEYQQTNPYTTQAFRTTNSRGGLTIRFALN